MRRFAGSLADRHTRRADNIPLTILPVAAAVARPPPRVVAGVVGSGGMDYS